MVDFVLNNSYLVLLFPLLSFAIIGLWMGSRYRKQSAQLAVFASACSFITALLITWAYNAKVLSYPNTFPEKTIIPINIEWLNFTPTLTGNMGIYLDPISVMMVIVITFISLLVNIYSIGYMKDDPSFSRFFALLSLFSFSMLGLVISTNLIQLFVFWELVGVSSYALIGFWYEKPSAVAASKKAFIITRFADAFFLLGIITVSYYTSTFDFLKINTPEMAALLNHSFTLGSLTINLLTLSTILIFMGGWGKSAMFPLHIWLPDAMEGPTPVSSIIHSATMVVAGVYLTARMFPLFSHSDITLVVIQVIGAFTAIFAAIIAITQNDIKRILAFSTLSQLGYMMFSLGVAKMGHSEHGNINPLGYTASMFHIFTHAFFKCMLFLGAGAIIHAVHSNNIEDMGGLKRKMPITYWSLLAACLAISGIYPFSGFWSKDEILLAALQSGHHITFLTGLVVSGLTAFYMFRFFFLTFHGQSKKTLDDVHEDPYMTFSIAILIIPTILAGFLCKDIFAETFLPNVPEQASHLAHPLWLPILASAVGLSGILLAWILYGQGNKLISTKIKSYIQRPYIITYNKFYFDEIYIFITKRIIFNLIAEPVKWFDKKIVDGIMDLTGATLHYGGRIVRLIHNGQLKVYLSATILGIIILLLIGHIKL